MDNQLLLALLEEVLGASKLTRKQNEAAFICPVHASDKKKLQVNLATGYWHCWVCQVENKMKGKSLFSLFKRANASPQQFERLSELVGEYHPRQEDSEEVEIDRRLPNEFMSLTDAEKTTMYRHAFHYIRSRGISLPDVLKYNIGYAEYGEYKNKVIVPSYDADGKLNFFACRAFLKDDPFKHQMPPWSKDIIGFECFINWNMPIVIVEGVYDAMAIKNNVIPLFGKTIGNALHLKILQNRVSDIYICLDRDAINSSMKYVETFIGEGRTVYFVDLPSKDPSQIGFNGMQEILRNTKPATMADVIRMRLR